MTDNPAQGKLPVSNFAPLSRGDIDNEATYGLVVLGVRFWSLRVFEMEDEGPQDTIFVKGKCICRIWDVFCFPMDLSTGPQEARG